jgi:hypothetical protein
MTTVPADNSAVRQSGQSDDAADALPDLRTALPPDAVLARARALSKRGKLPGFADAPAPDLFSADAHGHPFDRRLIATAAAEPGGTRVRFRLAWKPRTPAIFGVVLLVSIWPGLPITDSLLVSYSRWYEGLVSPDGWFRTWMWYLPLTVLPVPFLAVRFWKLSVQSTRASAAELLGRIAEAIDAKS